MCVANVLCITCNMNKRAVATRMSSVQSSVVVLLVVLGALGASVEGFYLLLPAGAKQCFSEEVMDHYPVTVHYKAKFEEAGHQISANIIDPHGKAVDTKTLTKKEGSFTFATDFDGPHEVCFTFHGNYKPIEFEMDFDGGATEKRTDGKHGPIKGDVNGYARRADEITPLVTAAVAEVEYLDKRHMAADETSTSTYRRVVWSTAALIIITTLLGLWQVHTLQKFFKAKKLV
jgi:hypothetical protein